MKNLDLNSYGVQEMNAEEIRTTEGGLFWFILGAIAGGMIYQYIDDAGGCNDAMGKGFSKGSQIF